MLVSLLNSAVAAVLSTQLNSGVTNSQEALTPGIQTTCLAIPANASISDSVSQGLLAQAMNVTDLEFASDLQHLTIDNALDEFRGLKQSFHPTANGSNRTLFSADVPVARTYQLTQKFYFEPGFDWGGENEGGKIGFGLSGGSAPSGGKIADDGFTARIMWRGNGDGSARLVVYAYAADRSNNLPFGDDHIFEGGTIPTGRWFEATFEVTTNSRPDEADGSLKAWFDGVPAMNVQNIQWQKAGSNIEIDAVSYSSFYGGNDSSWSPEGTNFVRVGDVCWSRPSVDHRLDRN